MTASAHVVVGDVPQIEPGGIVEVPIVLVQSERFDVFPPDGYSGMLRYNGSLMSVRESNGGTLRLPDVAVGPGDTREVKFEGVVGTRTNGLLQSIVFRSLLGTDTCTPLVLSDVAFTGSPVTVTTFDGRF